MIEFLGFDEDSIEFGITGETALQIAKLCGSPFNMVPQDRMKAACRVTLFRDPLTTEFCSVTDQSPRRELVSESPGLFDCSDPDHG